MRRNLRKFLALDPSDHVPLRLLSPVFGLSAAISIMVASVSKSLFLSANSIDKLPWMFLGAAMFTVVVSLAYTALMDRMSLEIRFKILLIVTAASFMGLRLWFPAAPKMASMVVLLWCPGMSYLVAVQGWSLSSELLPTRQAKRMVPVLASVATIGAVLGGLLVQTATPIVGAENLLWGAVVLLLILFLSLGTVCNAIREVSAHQLKLSEAAGLTEVFQDRTADTGSPLLRVWRRPLVRSLAAFAFFAQAASILVDFQFSAELQQHYDRDDMAGFLGTFYWLSNLLVLLLSLLVSRRLIRRLGISFILCGGAMALVLGSVAYLVVGSMGWGGTFWVIACASFVERLGHFAFTRSAMQMLVMPMKNRTAEQAKILVEGVVYKLASVLGAVVLLLWTATALHSLSPLIIVFGILACFAGFRTEPHYRQELNAGMSAGRIEGAMGAMLSFGLDRHSRGQIEGKISQEDRGEVLGALAVARDLKTPIDPEVLEEKILGADVEIALSALDTLNGLGLPLSGRCLRALTESSADVTVLRRAFRMVDEATVESALIRDLCEHDDDTLAAMAGVHLMRREGGYTTAEIEAEIERDLAELYLDVHARPPRMVDGQDRAIQVLRDLPKRLYGEDAKDQVAALQAMGYLALPSFIPLLVESLERRALRAAACAGLVAHGPSVLEQLSQLVHTEALSQITRISLTQVFEEIGDRHAVHLIGVFAEQDDVFVRSQAVAALWRMARTPMNPRLSRARIESLIKRDIELLKRFSAIEALLPAVSNPRQGFFLREVEHMQVNTEARVFRLFGLIYERESMYQAHLNYQSTDPRTRSNAIELLDLYVQREEHRVFVPLIERSEQEGGEYRPRTSVYLPVLESIDPENLLGQRETWFLDRLWKWSRQGAGPVEQWGDPLARVWHLTQMDVFRGLHGAELLPLSLRLEPTHHAEGAVLARSGEPGEKLFLVLSGTAEVFTDEQSLTQVGEGSSLGLASLASDLPYMAEIRAVTPLSVLEVSRSDVHNLISLYPEVSRGIIRILAGRVRIRIQNKERERADEV